MQAFYNLRVRTKLTIGFMIIALLAGLMGGYAMYIVQSMIQAEKELYKEVTLPISRLSEISTTFQKINVDLSNAVMSDDTRTIEEGLEKANKNRIQMGSLLEELDLIIDNEKLSGHYNQFVSQWNSFDNNLDPVIEMIKSNQDGEASIALSQDGMLGAILSHGQNLLKEMLTMQLVYAEDIGLANEKKASSTIILMTVVLLAVVFIAIALSVFLGKVIGLPLKILINAADKLAIGDIDVRIKQRSTDEMGNLMGSFGKMVENIKDQVEAAKKIAEGDLSLEIQPKSEKDVQSHSMQYVVHTLRGLADEAERLTKAAVAGKLSARANAEDFDGGYRDILEGVNSTLDAVIDPLNVAANYVDRISKGDIPNEITEEYQGGFNEIKDNLNTCIKAINSLVGDAGMLAEAALEGKLNTRADAGKHGGDFRKIVEGVNNTLDWVIGPLNVAANYIERIGKGDFVAIKNSLNNIILSLSQVMGDINEAANQVASGSRQVSDGSQALSQGSTEQASSIQELTASITEITSQTKANAVSANEASRLAEDAKANAAKGNGQMKEMLQSMADINESSTNISKIIKVIDDIAFQTNILALNAAVEAARAGQHGKGFAVVAEEVRNLAARSAEAAKDTTALIEGSISKVETGTRIANHTAQALSEIVKDIERVTDLVGSIATSSNEQATGITFVNRGIEQVSHVVQNNSATAEESAASSQELSSQAELLKEMVGRFMLNDSEPTILLCGDGYDKY